MVQKKEIMVLIVEHHEILIHLILPYRLDTILQALNLAMFMQISTYKK